MSTFKQRDNYSWRPNDNSVTTNLRYDLEAEHWTKSFRSAQLKQSSGATDMAFFGTIIALIFHVILLILVLLYDGIKWLFDLKDRKRMERARKERLAEDEEIAANEARWSKITPEDIKKKMDELGIEPMSALHPDFDKPNSSRRELTLDDFD